MYKLMQKLKHASIKYVEFILLMLVCIFLYFWFNHSFTLNNQANYRALTYNYLVGGDIKTPIEQWNKNVFCRQEAGNLSNDAHTWCQNAYPEKGIALFLQKIGYTPEPKHYQHAVISIQLNQHYQSLQQHFRQITSNKGTKSDIFDDDIVSADMLNDVQDRLHVNNVYGSTPLACSWWLLYAIERNTPTNKANINDINIARADLLNHQKKTEIFSSKTTSVSDWSLLNGINQHKLANQCKSLGSVDVVYKKTIDSVNSLYEYSNDYKRTIQTLSLTAVGHVVFIVLILSCFFVIKMMCYSMSFFYKLFTYTASWSIVYYACNYFLGYPLIDDYFTKISSIVIVALILFGMSNKNAYQHKYEAVSVVIYPIFSLILGVSAFFVLDWSLLSNYNDLRFLAIRQYGYIFLALMIMSIAPLLKDGIFEIVSKIIDSFYSVLRFIMTRKNAREFFKAAVIILLFMLVVASFLMINKERFANLGSETMRAIFIIVSAGFVSLLPSTSQQRSIVVFGLFALLILLLIFFVGGALKDFGPLMIISYSIIVLMMAKLLVWLSVQSWFKNKKPLLPTVMFLVLMISAVIVALNAFISLSELGTERTRERVVSMREPFASTSDQMALTRYFTASVPSDGYGLGGVPWRVDNGQGVPQQTQSDYVPMALYGILGPYKFFGFCMLYFVWITVLITKYRALSLGFNSKFTHQEMLNTFFSWVAVIWSVVIISQVCITLMGNLGIAPLTGVSWPFLSYGQVSLVINCFILGLIVTKTKLD